jgi:hypothetical protein
MAANLERLKKRIRTLEDWVDENEAIGGPEGTLDTFNYLISRNRQAEQMQGHLNQLQQYLQMFLQENELMDKWNEFIQERENAVQEQSPEEVPPRKEAEDGKEVGEEDSEGSETPEESET